MFSIWKQQLWYVSFYYICFSLFVDMCGDGDLPPVLICIINLEFCNDWRWIWIETNTIVIASDTIGICFFLESVLHKKQMNVKLKVLLDVHTYHDICKYRTALIVRYLWWWTLSCTLSMSAMFVDHTGLHIHLQYYLWHTVFL